MWYCLDENKEPYLLPKGEYPNFKEGERRVDETFLTVGEIDYRISTVFLGLDHRYGEGPPILFETMIFCDSDSELNEQMWRYSSYKQAHDFHQLIVQALRENRDPRLIIDENNEE